MFTFSFHVFFLFPFLREYYFLKRSNETVPIRIYRREFCNRPGHENGTHTSLFSRELEAKSDFAFFERSFRRDNNYEIGSLILIYREGQSTDFNSWPWCS